MVSESIQEMYYNIILNFIMYALVLHHVLVVPRILRTDCGTENTNLAFIQRYLRRSHADCFSGMESFRYGRSVSNQVRHNRIIKNDIFIIILYLA